jgi:hypothetical protein
VLQLARLNLPRDRQLVFSTLALKLLALQPNHPGLIEDTGKATNGRLDRLLTTASKGHISGMITGRLGVNPLPDRGQRYGEPGEDRRVPEDRS